MSKKPQTLKYWNVNDKSNGPIKTTMRSESDTAVGFYRHSDATEIIQKMLNENQDAFEKLGFDFSTIRFQISLATPPAPTAQPGNDY